MTSDLLQKSKVYKRMAVADTIAQALGETIPTAISQIQRIVYQCGTKQALAWLEVAQAREATGVCSSKTTVADEPLAAYISLLWMRRQV